VTDFERRLADALHDAVDQAWPPARLIDQIRQRHRRHRARVAVASFAAIAAAAAITLPLAAPAVSGGPPAVGLSGSPGTAKPSVPVVRPGTVLQDCSDQISGQYGAGWQRQSIQAGPLWFINVRTTFATNGGVTHRLAYGDLPVNAKDGSVTWVRVIGDARHYFRFLYGVPNHGTGNYTLRDGEAGVTFAACGPGRVFGQFYPGYTQFWGGFVISKVPACVSLGVWTTTARKPIRVTFAVGTIRCRQAS
jgi:hypothetical protein